MNPKQEIFKAYESQVDSVISQAELAVRTQHIFTDVLKECEKSQTIVAIPDSGDFKEAMIASAVDGNIGNHLGHELVSSVGASIEMVEAKVSPVFDDFQYGSDQTLGVEGITVKTSFALLAPKLEATTHPSNYDYKYDVLKLVLSTDEGISIPDATGAYVARPRDGGPCVFFKIMNKADRLAATKLSPAEEQEVVAELEKASAVFAASSE